MTKARAGEQSCQRKPLEQRLVERLLVVRDGCKQKGGVPELTVRERRNVWRVPSTDTRSSDLCQEELLLLCCRAEQVRAKVKDNREKNQSRPG